MIDCTTLEEARERAYAGCRVECLAAGAGRVYEPGDALPLHLLNDDKRAALEGGG